MTYGDDRLDAAERSKTAVSHGLASLDLMQSRERRRCVVKARGVGLYQRVRQWPFSPWGEGGPKDRMRGPAFRYEKVAPHQLGRMTYGHVCVSVAAKLETAVSHGLASSPPRGEGECAAASARL